MAWVRMTDKERTPRFGNPYVVQVICRSDAEADEMEQLARTDARWSRVMIMTARIYNRKKHPDEAVESVTAERFRSGGFPVDQAGVIGYDTHALTKGG